MVVPEPPVITYNPGQNVYDGTMVSLTCVSETKDPAGTEIIWLQLGKLIKGEMVTGLSTVSNTITFRADLNGSAARYECNVIHRNLPEPWIKYGSITGTCTPTILYSSTCVWSLLSQLHSNKVHF